MVANSHLASGLAWGIAARTPCISQKAIARVCQSACTAREKSDAARVRNCRAAISEVSEVSDLASLSTR